MLPHLDPPVPLPVLVTVAGRRWTIEESCQSGQGRTGLDEHQVRRWTSWRRWTVLAMLAHAIRTVLAATATPPPPLDAHPNDRVHTDGPTRIPLTRNEVQRLIAALISPVQASLGHVLHWSSGAAEPRHAHESATTDDRRQPPNDHEVRLQY